MKKKIVAVLLILCACFLLAACGKGGKDPQSTQSAESTQIAEISQMGNPWRDITQEQAEELCPHSFRVPDGAADVRWSVLDSAADSSGLPGVLVQLSFDLNGYSYTAREQRSGDTWTDSSGMYYTWTAQDTMLLKNWDGADLTGIYYRYIGESEYADLCIWFDPQAGVSYSLGVAAKDLDGFDLQAVVEALSPSAGAQTETEAAPGSLYDTDAYAAAAQAVRNEYVQVIQAGIDSFDEAAHPEIPWYTAALTRYDDNRYYEGYYDFDGNGVPEMVIAIGSEIYPDLKPLAVYAFDGQSMHYLAKEHPLGERSYLSWSDGLFVVHGSGGASSGILAVFRIADDGWSTESVDLIEYEYSDATHVTFTPEYGRITPEEAGDLANQAPLETALAIDWNCFYPVG